MTEVTAYNNPSAPTHRQWIAYVVMDNGNLWGVYATAPLQWQAKLKIQTLWESERAKISLNPKPTFNRSEVFSAPASSESGWSTNPTSIDAWASEKPARAGSVWLINKVNRNKCRVQPHVAEHMIASGDWERGGPRSR